MSLVHNEQAKLTATYLNGIAVAVAAVGGIAPSIALFAQESRSGNVRLIAISFVCFLLSVVLHLAMRRALTKLDES